MALLPPSKRFALESADDRGCIASTVRWSRTRSRRTSPTWLAGSWDSPSSTKPRPAFCGGNVDFSNVDGAAPIGPAPSGVYPLPTGVSLPQVDPPIPLPGRFSSARRSAAHDAVAGVA